MSPRREMYIYIQLYKYTNIYRNPPTRVGVTWKHLMQDPNGVDRSKSKIKIQNPNSRIQNPKSKTQTAPFGAAAKRRKTKLIQNPKFNPKAKIQNPKSKIQDPKSKRPVWSLDFGFGVAGLGPEAMAMQQMKIYGRPGHPNLA